MNTTTMHRLQRCLYLDDFKRAATGLLYFCCFADFVGCGRFPETSMTDSLFVTFITICVRLTKNPMNRMLTYFFTIVPTFDDRIYQSIVGFKGDFWKYVTVS